MVSIMKREKVAIIVVVLTSQSIQTKGSCERVRAMVAYDFEATNDAIHVKAGFALLLRYGSAVDAVCMNEPGVPAMRVEAMLITRQRENETRTRMKRSINERGGEYQPSQPNRRAVGTATSRMLTNSEQDVLHRMIKMDTSLAKPARVEKYRFSLNEKDPSCVLLRIAACDLDLSPTCTDICYEAFFITSGCLPRSPCTALTCQP